MGINYCSFGVYVVDICFSLEIVVTENECIDKEVGVKFAKLCWTHLKVEQAFCTCKDLIGD